MDDMLWWHTKELCMALESVRDILRLGVLVVNVVNHSHRTSQQTYGRQELPWLRIARRSSVDGFHST